MNVITPGEMGKGMIISILSIVNKNEVENDVQEEIFPFIITKNKSVKESFFDLNKGVPFEIKAINLPYLLLKNIRCDNLPAVVVDTRDYTFIEMSTDFIEEYMQNKLF